MSAGEYCNRDIVVVERTESVRSAINLMRKNHVGDIVVVETLSNVRTPLGILTDRDIVIEIQAEDVDPDTVNVDDVMSYNLATINTEISLLDTIKLMRVKGVRRLPVVNDEGELQGLLTVDDLLELVVEQLTDIVGLVSNEITNEIRSRN
jgi:CBS domain-containing protein